MSMPLSPLPPASRELMEMLWAREEPMTTRQVHDGIARRYPDRERRINTTATLLGALVEQGWVERQGASAGRWKWKAAVSRPEGLWHLAFYAVADFSEVRRDGWFLIHAALGAVLPYRPAVRPPRTSR